MIVNNEVKPQITTAAKQPLETPGSKSSAQVTKTINAAKASADGANVLTIAKHMHARGPKQHRWRSICLSKQDHRRGKTSADGANTLTTANLYKRGPNSGKSIR